ncbi:MAG TPA: hypothetical protein VHW04_06335 [Solirubrobacteraceae bacterium]|jgi:hypothetical protein|nr:hypothetical protein [Solirubrobacteraceae bacterium]
MADLHVTYYERTGDDSRLVERGREEFEAATSPRAAQLALEAAERWIEPDRRNRTYRIERLLPPD